MTRSARCAGYRLMSELGRGGTGVVFAAEHQQTGKRVAIKLLLAELSESRQAVSRFFHEARLAACVEDPGMVAMYESGYADDGSAFLVMELLHGESLAARRARGERMSLKLLCYVGKEIARIAGAAHAQQIVHRDLKPENVFLEHAAHMPFGARIKVLDFGMAKLNPDGGPYSFITEKGTIIGTPLYMAPEQCRGADVDARSDVYALGCILYELACGQPPFVRGSLGLILGAHVYEPVPRPRTLAPALPEALELLLLRTLAKAPEERPQTMAELSLALADVEAAYG